MNLDSIKALLIGTAIAFSGGLLRVLISIQNKEKKKPWEHVITLMIVVIVGFTMSYLMNRAELHDKWYSTGILFVLGYGYDKYLKMITTNLPNWIDKSVNLFIETRYGIRTDRQPGNQEEKVIELPEDQVEK
ncbi:hypothetical protein SAMN05421856_10951 [Chryseobacterium taichungense]|uniref:LydA holin phage, holin superfamily III n=1 Tax=Chryseobacterium taichungense TaxID=295069 RepID=A0A1H8CHX2_9FLAO|nr:hypothetical protein [Chryseobacterium taichungense]SEM94014.1 hypothetical protein SAMN05421856_10951 [Chryseobacterium taichungense]